MEYRLAEQILYEELAKRGVPDEMVTRNSQYSLHGTDKGQPFTTTRLRIILRKIGNHFNLDGLGAADLNHIKTFPQLVRWISETPYSKIDEKTTLKEIVETYRDPPSLLTDSEREKFIARLSS